MNITAMIGVMLDDLALVAASLPNERLPKEEQIRCSIYHAIRPLYQVVCAERGYGSIDEGSRIECDLWAVNPGSTPIWIEFKRCWSVKGWHNKPPEQLSYWLDDINKLRQISTDSERYFILVGLFDFDPFSANQSLKGVANNIQQFFPSQLVHSKSKAFTWRRDDGISWIGAWVWKWPVNITIM